MITFLLLPFLLAIRVTVDVSSWYYGPEYTYAVKINMLAVDEAAAEFKRGYDISTNLKCRPRAPDTLNCRFEKNPTDRPIVDDTISDFDISELPFQVKFDRIGIRELLIGNSLRPWEVDMVRAIVNQLNIGFDVRNAPDGLLWLPEISYLGQSRCKLLISRAPSDGQTDWKNKDYEIQPMEGCGISQGDTIDIEKTRIIAQSPRLQKYFFGSKEAYRDPPQNIFKTFKSSVSRMVISNTNFTSYTANEIVVSRTDNKNVTLYERITVDLVSVTAAKSEMPAIRNAERTSFFVHKYIGDDSSEEDQ